MAPSPLGGVPFPLLTIYPSTAPSYHRGRHLLRNRPNAVRVLEGAGVVDLALHSYM
jgi:hypothetical protein